MKAQDDRAQLCNTNILLSFFTLYWNVFVYKTKNTYVLPWMTIITVMKQTACSFKIYYITLDLIPDMN
jgi:hypothetical protein